mgnify:CR=1 FL=1
MNDLLDVSTISRNGEQIILNYDYSVIKNHVKSKKPVIISDFDNVGEFIVDDVNGLTFRPNDHVALSQCVKKLYQNRALYSGLGHANYQNAITNHDRIKVMSNLILKISDNI